MNITSLLITLAGIIFIVALYIISRVSQSKLPKNQTSIIPKLKDENGEPFTSILDDIPARDGSTPVAKRVDNEINSKADESFDADASAETENTPSDKPEQQQHILFISGKNEEGLDGRLVQQALKANGLVLADMDIYHYFPVMDVDLESDKYSLFRVANGVAPWTLKQEDLLGKKLAGLSIVMITPTKINDSEAISLFISLSEQICEHVNGVLKNQQQQVLTNKEKKNLLYSFKN